MSQPRIKAAIGCILILISVAAECYADKKNFRGLFGSYRREQYIENEARNTDIGMNLMLSTLVPLSPIVKSSEDPTRANLGDPMYYATFFNLEAQFFVTLNYHWEVFGNLAYYTYETRKENASRTDPTLPLFHQFEMTIIPLVGGIKYRLTTTDIVPYVGVGGGLAYVKRKGFYDYNPVIWDQQYLNVVVGEALAGLEFFFSPNAGIRLEVAAFYMALPARTFDTGGTPANFPILYYQANPWSIRYASGVFVLF